MFLIVTLLYIINYFILLFISYYFGIVYFILNNCVRV